MRKRYDVSDYYGGSYLVSIIVFGCIIQRNDYNEEEK